MEYLPGQFSQEIIIHVLQVQQIAELQQQEDIQFLIIIQEGPITAVLQRETIPVHLHQYTREQQTGLREVVLTAGLQQDQTQVVHIPREVPVQAQIPEAAIPREGPDLHQAEAAILQGHQVQGHPDHQQDHQEAIAALNRQDHQVAVHQVAQGHHPDQEADQEVVQDQEVVRGKT